VSKLTDTLIRGSFFRVLNPVLNIVVAFFMIPFVINAIGDRWYGLWILVGTLVGYYGFFELGISTANERFISRALGKEDEEEKNRVFNTSLFIFCLVGILALIASGVIALISPRFMDNPDDVKVFRAVIMFVGLNMAMSFPARGFYGFLYAHYRYDIVYAVGIVNLLIRTGLIVLFLGRGHGIIALAIITLCSDSFQYVVTLIYVRIKYPSTRINPIMASKEITRMLLGYSFFSFIANIAKQFRFQIAAFIITAFLGLTFVTHFNIGSRVAAYYLMLVTNAIALMKPVFSNLEGQGDFEQIRDKYIFSVKLNAIMSIFIGGSILIYGKAFILRWMGTEYLDSYHVLAILTVGLIFGTLQIAPISMLFGISKHKFYAILMMAEAAANILLSIVLIQRYGIIGVALGTTIPMLITHIFILPVYANRVIEFPFARYARVFLGCLALGGAIHLASWLLIRDYLTVSYQRIVLLGISTSAVFIILNVFIILKKQERRYFKIPL
jgi:O-antigen/teichoic acid export membrane protein